MARTLVCLRYFLIGGAIVVGVCGIIESVCAGYFIYQLYEYSPLTPSNVCGSAITLLVMGLVACMIGWCAWQFLDFSNRGQVISIFTESAIIAFVVRLAADLMQNLQCIGLLADKQQKPSRTCLRNLLSGSTDMICSVSDANLLPDLIIQALVAKWQPNFSIALIVIAVINTSAGIWALVRHEQVDLLPSAHLEEVFELAVSDHKHVWDHMQTRLNCCGINGPADYRNHEAIPWSCCDSSTYLNSSDAKGLCTTMYARGCQHVVINRTRSILLHTFLLALCTILLQVCFITCMACYTKACRERIERRKEVMIAAQALARASKDLGINDNLLNQSKMPEATTNV